VRGHQLDVARLLTPDRVDLEALGREVIERFTQQVVPAEAVCEWLEHPLDSADDGVRAPDVLRQEDPAARSKHSLRLPDRRRVVGMILLLSSEAATWR